MIKSTFRHRGLASGGWQRLSLAEQLGNIGSEVGRARRWDGKDGKIFAGAVERALELFDLTLQDRRWQGRLREIARAREIFCDTVLGAREYGDSLEGLERYFYHFAFLAQREKASH